MVHVNKYKKSDERSSQSCSDRQGQIHNSHLSSIIGKCEESSQYRYELNWIESNWTHFQLALLILVIIGFFNDFVLSVVHERVPEQPPLPDIVFERTPYIPQALVFSEYLILISLFIMLLITIFHKYRWIILRWARQLICSSLRSFSCPWLRIFIKKILIFSK